MNLPQHLTQTNALAHEEYFESLFEREFIRLKENGHTYLDYTGAAVYPNSLIRSHFNWLKYNNLGNPHSSNPTSSLSTTFVNITRESILNFFNANDYFCIFTQNASNAIKIIGESFPWSLKSNLLLLSDNHNSMNGLREFCNTNNGIFNYAQLKGDLTINESDLEEKLVQVNPSDRGLFAFPAQSNVSGVKHDFSWISRGQDLGWEVLLDVSAYVPGTQLDLSEIKPDYVAMSFYKMFGYPSGIGCLLVKKNKLESLQKPWFAGGTVRLTSAIVPNHLLTSGHEKFEDGTINYTSIPAVKFGLDFLSSISMERISERIESLQKHLFIQLNSLKHTSGHNVVEIYGPKDRSNCGGTLVMNFYNALGEKYAYEEVQEKANQLLISLRTGCFCNPGIDETINHLDEESINQYFQIDQIENKDQLQKMKINRGAVRVSVGIATRLEDLETFINFVASFINKI